MNVNNVSSSADTRQTNREKTIAQSYWQQVFNEDKEKKTLVVLNNSQVKYLIMCIILFLFVDLIK